MKKITDYGANIFCPDNAEYIQKNIDSMTEGGKVVIPSGVFLCSTIQLHSNVTLYLEEGAILKAVADTSKYAKSGFVDSFGEETNSFIICKQSRNVSILGEGMIDISADDFLDYEISSEDNLRYMDDAEEIPAKIKERILRPIIFDDCVHVNVRNIKVMNSPCWTLTFHNCKDIKVSEITIENNIRAPHSDGVHLSGCNGALIANCHLTCGDDCIALTSLLDDKFVCKNVIITNCIMQSSSAGVRIGHKSSKVENVLISNLCIHETNRGFAVFAGDNGYVKNIKIRNVIMDTHIYAGDWWGKGEPFVICSANSNGVIENIELSDIYGRSENVGVVVGDVRKLSVSNLKLSLVQTDKRKYALDYDIAPNGSLGVKNEFLGQVYVQDNIDIDMY